MPGISTACPNCDKKLRLSTRPAQGKRIKCPACGDPFVPEFEGEDEATSIEEKPSVKAKVKAAPRSRDDDDDDLPVKRKRRGERDDAEDSDDRPARKKKGKKQAASSSSAMVWGLVAGGAALVLACGGVGFGAFVWPGFLRSTPAPPTRASRDADVPPIEQAAAGGIANPPNQAPGKAGDVAAIPPAAPALPPAPASLAGFVLADANLLLGANVKNVRDAGQIDGLIAQFQSIVGADDLPPEIRDMIRDCDKVLLSMNTSEMIKMIEIGPGAPPGPGVRPGPLGPKKGIKPVAPKQAKPAPVAFEAPKWTVAALMANPAAIARIKAMPTMGAADMLAGKYPVYRQRQPSGQTTLAAFPGDRLIVMSQAKDQELATILDRGMQAAALPASQLSRMTAKVEQSHLWAAYATDAGARQMLGMAPLMFPLPPGAPPEMQNAVPALAKIKGAGVGIDRLPDGKLKLQLHVDCDDAAAAQSLKDGGESLKLAILNDKQPNPQATYGRDVGSITFVNQDTMASASAMISGQTIDFLKLAASAPPQQATAMPSQGNNPPPKNIPATGKSRQIFNKSVFNLNAKASNDIPIQLQQGKQITVKAQYSSLTPNNNLDLYIFEGNPGLNKIAARDEKPANLQKRNFPLCTATFVPQTSGQFTIRVMNRGPGVTGSILVTVSEQ